MSLRRLGLPLACLAACFLASCSGGGKPETGGGNSHGGGASGSGGSSQGQGKRQGKRSDYLVRAATVRVAPVNYAIESTGSVEAQDVYRVDARVAGTIEGVAFNEGDEVAPETVLCRISPQSYEMDAAKAQASYRKAQADLENTQRRQVNQVALAEVRLRQAELEVERRKIVQAAGAVAEEEVKLYESRRDLAAIELKDMREAAETLVTVLQAAIREMEAEWKMAEDRLRKSAVVPPISGVVEERLVTNGTHVAQGAPIAVIVDRRTLRLRFTLSEAQAPHVRPGAQVSFRVQAYPDRDFQATVYRIGDLSDEATRQVACWARVDMSGAADARLKAGSFATVKLVTEQKSESIVIPLTAALPTELGFVVFVVEDGKALRREVRLGLNVTGESVEVLSGLKPGETIVIEGGNALQDGVKVRDRDEKDKGEASKS